MNSFNVNNYNISRRFQPEINKNYKWLVYSGIALIILGIITIVGNILLQSYIVGILIFLAGTIIIIHAFKFWNKKIAGFAIHIILGTIYLFIAIISIIQLQYGLNILFAVSAIIYLIAGLFRIIGAIIEGVAVPGWLITFLSGIINIIFTILIFIRWHNINMYTLINIVGIDISVTGLALFMLGFTILKIKDETIHKNNGAW